MLSGQLDYGVARKRLKRWLAGRRCAYSRSPIRCRTTARRRIFQLRLRATLGEEGFQVAWQSGQELTLEQAVAEDLAVADVIATSNQSGTRSKEKKA